MLELELLLIVTKLQEWFPASWNFTDLTLVDRCAILPSFQFIFSHWFWFEGESCSSTENGQANAVQIPGSHWYLFNHGRSWCHWTCSLWDCCSWFNQQGSILHHGIRNFGCHVCTRVSVSHPPYNQICFSIQVIWIYEQWSILVIRTVSQFTKYKMSYMTDDNNEFLAGNQKWRKRMQSSWSGRPSELVRLC